MRTATAIYTVSAALLCMGVGTLVLVWGLRVSISEALEPQETILSGGSQPIEVRMMQDPVVYSKTVDGTLVTWTGPARNDGETEKEYGARTWALWQQFCAGLPE